MPTKLLENINSDYIEAYGYLLSKNSQIPIAVYVESHEDIAFWNGILKDYQSDKIRFDIKLPSYDSLAKGKNKALERLIENVGERLIICIDSDYDYLLQGKTKKSKLINESKYIFQTYAYSIENLRCFSPSLHHVSVQATNKSHGKIDFEELLKRYSSITYPLFLWSVYFEMIGDTESMNLNTFCSFIRVHETETIKISEKGKSHFEALTKRINAQLDSLNTLFSEHIESVENLKNELSAFGVEPENTYLFMQGHTVENGFVLMFLNPLCSELEKERIAEIKELAKHPTEKKDQINHYKNNKITPVNALKANTEYKSCFLYHKIKADLDEYMATIAIK